MLQHSSGSMAHQAFMQRDVLQNAAGEEPDVFLYCKSHLRPGASVPEPETLEPIHVTGEPSKHT
jgi:hypothetical protein